jgi:protein subunit release factor B
MSCSGRNPAGERQGHAIVKVMGIFTVSIQKEEQLQEKMEALNIREEDIEESFIRSGGRGGQHVNKTSTCVYLKHLPTGIEVKCQEERSQALNRYRARVILAKKVEQIIRGKESEETRRIEKIRRQKRKRSKRAKEKMLAEKKITAEKKKLRGPVAENNY